VIVGNGVAGITAARHLRKRCTDRIVVVGSESRYHYARPALMYRFMGHVADEHLHPYPDSFWFENRIELICDHVVGIDRKGQCITLASGATQPYTSLLLATGSSARKAPWLGSQASGVQSFTSLPDLELLERNVIGVSSAVVIGGGLTAMEVAEMLRSRRIAVTMLVRDARVAEHMLPDEEAGRVLRHLHHHGVDVRCATHVDSIVADGTGRVSHVVTTAGSVHSAQLVVCCIGVEPTTDLAVRAGLDVGRGVLVDAALRTSDAAIYAAGDCAELPGGRVEQTWYAARAQGEHAAAVMCGHTAIYRPPFRHDSAKFFDIEYQSYGVVDTAYASWTWAPEDGQRFVRICYDAHTRCVVGAHALGVRMRQDVWSAWINEGVSIDTVLRTIRNACFDPELFLTPQQLETAARRGAP
jgi:NAD(P)H-nitrite reductase large subunit